MLKKIRKRIRIILRNVVRAYKLYKQDKKEQKEHKKRKQRFIKYQLPIIKQMHNYWDSQNEKNI